MGDEDPCDHCWSDIGKNELALGALSRIKKQALSVPPKQVGSVVAAAGLLLARCPKDNKIFDAQRTILFTKKTSRSIPAVPDIRPSLDLGTAAGKNGRISGL